MIALDRPIITPRLRLEPVTPRLAAAAREGEAVFARTLGAEAPADWCAASLALVARSAPASWGPAHAPTRVVAVHHEQGCVIGDVRFEPTQHPLGEIEIGYGVARSRRRQGYGSEAAGAVIDFIFAESAIETIVAGCDHKNIASVKTLRKLGFWLDSTPGSAFWWVIDPELRRSARA